MGFESTLAKLRLRAPEEHLVRWTLEVLPTYSGESKGSLFMLFISNADQEVVGCTSVQ
jgi:hypothetical protein